MSRKKEINDLLKYLKKEYKKQKIEITEESIYDTLQNYRFSAEEIKMTADNLFPLWIERFKNKPNIECFHTMNQGRFLQFRKDHTFESKCIKLYVSLDPNAYFEGVNIIFDFIEKNNMKTASKVADKIRSDEIVIRLESTADAEKVIEFINSNPYLVANARPTNPFLNREGIVGIGYDDLISYNETIAYFVSDYLNNTKRPSYDSFIKYMNDKYVNLFQNQIELDTLIQSKKYQRNLARIQSDYYMINNPELYIYNNYRIVFQAILNNICDENYKKMYDCLEESKFIYAKTTSVDKYQLFDNYIRYAFEKYNHNIDVVCEYLYRYSQGDENSITRDNGYRDLFIYNITPYKVMIFTNNDIYNYVSSVVGYDRTIRTDNVTTDLGNKDFDMFIEGLRATFEAHGENQLVSCIPELLKGNFKVMSNGDYNFRNYFIEKYNQDQLAQFAVNSLNRIIGDREIPTEVLIGNVIFEILKDDYGFISQDRGR